MTTDAPVMCSLQGCTHKAVSIPQLEIPLVGVDRRLFTLKGQLNCPCCAIHAGEWKATDLIMEETREMWEIMNRMSATNAGSRVLPLDWENRFVTPLSLNSEGYKMLDKLSKEHPVSRDTK